MFDNNHQILWIRVGDDYNSLPKKVIRSYKAIIETFDFKYLFKTDDDQILVNDQFFNVVKGLTSVVKNKPHYGGFVVDVKQDHISQYYKIHPELPTNVPVLKTRYCSGRFYFLSNPAIQNILTKQISIEKEYFEDYAMGYYLDQVYKHTMINLATNYFFTDIELSDFSG